jgi:SAM-dependent methyltransferase
MNQRTESARFDQSYYRENYPNYDRQNPPRKLQFYAQTVEQHRAKLGSPKRIHDVGCCFGSFLEALGSDWEKFGSDPSDFAIGKARQRLPNALFKVGPGTARKIFSGHFGVVTAFDVIEHVPDLEDLAGAVREELSANGLFIFSVPVYDGLTGPVVQLLDRDPTHLHKWPRQRWLDWSGKHFEIVDWFGLFRYLLPTGYYVHFSTRLFKGHSPAILVVCRMR